MKSKRKKHFYYLRGVFREKVANKIGELYCFYPANYPSYNGSNAKKTEFGVSVDLQKNVKSHWPNDILRLRMDAYYETKTRLRIKVPFNQNLRSR